jgi:hypothetical protein
MKEILTKYVKGCVMCSTCNPTNRKLGLYSPLPAPSHPWECISMDFVGEFINFKRGSLLFVYRSGYVQQYVYLNDMEKEDHY